MAAARSQQIASQQLDDYRTNLKFSFSEPFIIKKQVRILIGFAPVEDLGVSLVVWLLDLVNSNPIELSLREKEVVEGR
ncbi:hypothetical protein AKJ16_DCAP24850 [Drosera capensis]